jgi:hypothetical protein
LVLALDGPALMLGDNISVVLNATVPKCFEEEYHRVIEAIVARIMRFAYIKKE